MQTFLKWAYVLARYIVSFLVIGYGFAKLNGAQFNIIDSELDKPMGDVSPFWLTWYYFGYSRLYGNFIALVQVGGGVLLMFRRTTLLGTCLLLPVIGNIILIDVFFGIAYSALPVAVFIFVMLLFIGSRHWRELLDVFWTRQNAVFPTGKRRPLTLAAKAAVCVLFIAVPCAASYWVANYNNRRPTPIDGTWDVVKDVSDPGTAAVPSVIFFERNVAYMAVFKHSSQDYKIHHFEVEPSKQSITIWEEWMKRDKRIFQGTYDVSGSQLVLQGRFEDTDQEITLRLTKRTKPD
jgi:hypothetical protein